MAKLLARAIAWRYIIGKPQFPKDAKMFYQPAKGHGLPHNPFKAIVSPRPIGWISTRDAQGRANLAPYSFFNAINENPPMVMFSSGPRKLDIDEPKDSVANIRNSGEFCVNMVSYALRDAMNITCAHYPQGVDEFDKAGLQKAQAKMIDVPFVRDAPAVMECTLHEIIELPGGQHLVLGMVVGIHIDDAHIKDGLLDVTRYQPLSRLGYKDYARIAEVFSLDRPKA